MHEEAENLVVNYEEQLEKIQEDIQNDTDKEIAEAKQAQDKAEDLVAIYAERLEDIHEDADRRIDPSELSQYITCEKCAKYSWYPFMYMITSSAIQKAHLSKILVYQTAGICSASPVFKIGLEPFKKTTIENILAFTGGHASYCLR
ncbi:hypothetical protein EV421DRAFT_1905934 [Armillaria borealis]|uniref:Uncharacterized protein n=1 Tax=Armillaria borealis TaxID=47425 RepID=A0AA39JBM9_9AGAR|nr:hypothetical protein EV421DRAFT_1905934 [Armillaria borealis]